jgi:hypothetical protein
MVAAGRMAGAGAGTNLEACWASTAGGTMGWPAGAKAAPVRRPNGAWGSWHSYKYQVPSLVPCCLARSGVIVSSVLGSPAILACW